MNKDIIPSKITIEDLAIMIAKGFKEVADNLNAFKKEMYEFRDEMYIFKKETKSEFKELRNISNENGLKLRNHEHRLCKVETKLDMA